MATTSEIFKIWLETIYVSEKTKKPLTSGTQYITGLKALGKKLNLPDDGIFQLDLDLARIRSLLDFPQNFHKDHSSHFNAFLKFNEYYLERGNSTKRPLQRSANVFKRQQVEIIAIEITIKHFESLGYFVTSKEKDNIGWDLEAINAKETIFIEVKGLSGKNTLIELTPNEYKNLKERKVNYRVCIVTKALTNPFLEIFKFNSNQRCWTNDNNEILEIKEMVSARMYKE